MARKTHEINIYKKNKYKNIKHEYNGIKFDSAREARRYLFLKDREERGEIADLEMQVKYVLIPAQREPDKVGTRGGIIKGKVIERECAYKADFVYKDLETNETVVEDTKGFRTKGYIIKRKLMLYVHGIRIKEV